MGGYSIRSAQSRQKALMTAACSEQSAVCNVQFGLCTLQFGVCSMAVCSGLCAVCSLQLGTTLPTGLCCSAGSEQRTLKICKARLCRDQISLS